MINRKLILQLYRTHLSLCRHIGYQYGSWNPCIQYSELFLFQNRNRRHLLKMYKHDLGYFMFNVIRNEYKNNKYIYDPDVKSYKVDYAFFVIRNFPYLLNRKIRI